MWPRCAQKQAWCFLRLRQWLVERSNLWPKTTKKGVPLKLIETIEVDWGWLKSNLRNIWGEQVWNDPLKPRLQKKILKVYFGARVDSLGWLNRGSQSPPPPYTAKSPLNSFLRFWGSEVWGFLSFLNRTGNNVSEGPLKWRGVNVVLKSSMKISPQTTITRIQTRWQCEPLDRNAINLGWKLQ